MCLVLLSMDPSPIIVYDSLNSVTNYFCWALTGVTLADWDSYPTCVDGLTWAMLESNDNWSLVKILKLNFDSVSVSI